MVITMNNKIEFIIPKDKTEFNYIGFDFANYNSKFIFPPQYLDEKIR